MGRADVLLSTLAGASVRGTLVSDADLAGFTLIKTGAALADGVYTVTLRSGADAFGNLDGNGDGIAGDDYAGSITVFGGATANRVSVSDLTRGPGQAINGSLGVSFTNANGSKITAVRFNLRYDPALLTLTGADLAAGLPAGTKLSTDVSMPGLARFTLAAPAPLPTGTVKLVNLKGSVPTTAPYGARKVLDVMDVFVNGSVAAADDDGVELIAYIGDASGSASYNTFDAQRIERVANAQDSGFSAYRMVDPMLVADVNGSGTVTLADRDIVSQEVQFLATGNVSVDRVEIPPIPAGIPPIVFSGPDPLVSLPTDVNARPGQIITVPVNLDTALGLESVQLRIGYDADAVEVLAVRRGTLTIGFTQFIASSKPGVVYVDLSGPVLGEGTGSLVELDLRIKDKASGQVRLDLQAATLNDGHLTLGQQPRLGADPTDGWITVDANQTAPGLAASALLHAATEGTRVSNAAQVVIPETPGIRALAAMNATLEVATGNSARFDIARLVGEADGGARTISVAKPSHGTLTRNIDGTYLYSPSPGYTGTDSFTYTVSDGKRRATATVDIAVTRAASASIVVYSAPGGTLRAGNGNTPVIDWEKLSSGTGYSATRLPRDENDWLPGFLGTRIKQDNDLSKMTGLKITLGGG